MSVNKVILVGNLGVDPELLPTKTGTKVCRLKVATNRVHRNAEDTLIEETEWHTIKCFGNLAESCHFHIAKGRQIYVEGYIHSQRWTDKEGADRFTYEVIAERIQFLGARSAQLEKAEVVHEEAFL